MLKKSLFVLFTAMFNCTCHSSLVYHDWREHSALVNRGKDVDFESIRNDGIETFKELFIPGKKAEYMRDEKKVNDIAKFFAFVKYENLYGYKDNATSFLSACFEDLYEKNDELRELADRYFQDYCEKYGTEDFVREVKNQTQDHTESAEDW